MKQKSESKGRRLLKGVPNKKCLIWNPYTQTIKIAYLQHSLENWYAVIGTNQVEQFYMNDREGTACLYADDLRPMQGQPQQGLKLRNWQQPVMGILLFVGPPDNEGETTSITDKAIALLRPKIHRAWKGLVVRI